MTEANQLSDTVNEIAKKIQEQQRLLQIKIMIQDILGAYNGKLNWNDYQKERNLYNAKIRENNNQILLNLKENNYKFTYQGELPILDFHVFMIAQELGKLERGGK